jgi:hypothetical protein
MSRKPSLLNILFSLSLFFSTVLTSVAIEVPKETPSNNAVNKSYSIEEYEECLPMSPAINFTAGSLFIGAGRNSIWLGGP